MYIFVFIEYYFFGSTRLHYRTHATSIQHKCVFLKRIHLKSMISTDRWTTSLQHDSLWNDKCNYIQPDNCDNLNKGNYNLILLQLNIRGLLSHQDELKLLLQKLYNKNTSIDLVLLCETFLNKKTEHLIDIPGYTIITNNRTQSKG